MSYNHFSKTFGPTSRTRVKRKKRREDRSPTGEKSKRREDRKRRKWRDNRR